MAEALAYPFLFVTIFFEAFVLVTLLSAPARVARGRLSRATPSVAMIVPCFNEAATVAKTAESLLALDYPREKLTVILVNDGSTDGTREAMERFSTHPQVTIVHKANGGKHTALNAGIEMSNAELVGCLDADSFVEKDALHNMIACFEDPQVAAATAAMSVHAPSTLLEHMQNIEYLFGIALRHALASVNGLYVVPGPFSLYRRSVLEKVGGFRHGYQAEDMEMALRLQKAGYLIENAPRSRVYTSAPKSMFGLIKQRTRWTSGFIRNISRDYRGLVGNRRYGALGTVTLPIAITSITSGVLLFVISTYTFAASLVYALSLRFGIPVEYAVTSSASKLDWFYAPHSAFLLLALITIGATLLLVITGNRISKTAAPITRGFVLYASLYGILAPLWILRAVTDVLLGKNRAWR